MPLQPRQILNKRYRIVKLLGKGGYGAVYRAWDLHLDSACALKENLDITPEAQKQFRREAVILANLQHPNLPRVRDHFFLHRQGQYLVMDFVEGEDLQEMLERHGGPLPENQVLPWIEQVCNALSYLHTQNPPIIHRDIKPANIKITPQGKALLVDFGIAKIYNPNLRTTIGARAVTPGFSPHEQYGQGKTDVRTDIYALGATLYTLLTGREPIESLQRVVKDSLLPPKRINSSISSGISDVIQNSMQVNPNRRYQDIKLFKTALLSASSGQRIKKPSLFSNLNYYKKWFPWIIGLVFLAFLISSIWPDGGLEPFDGTKTAIVTAVLPSNTTNPSRTPTLTFTESPTLTPTVVPSSTNTKIPSATSTDVPSSTPTETLAFGIGSIQVNPIDGMEMVNIPAGNFLMGSSESELNAVVENCVGDGQDRGNCEMWYQDESPQHTVYLDPYWIYKTKVTNAMFANFLNDQGNQNGEGAPWFNETKDALIHFNGGTWQSKSGYADHPVFEVTWYGAQAYCEWAGQRLPTEAEWEKAARGVNGNIYPWGDDFDCKKGNFDDETEGDAYVVPGGAGCDGFDRTSPVSSFPDATSPFGVLDMVGNTWEWVFDWYLDTYYTNSPHSNPLGPAAGVDRVLRSGSWSDDSRVVRAAHRNFCNPVDLWYIIGFRCAHTAYP